MEPFYALYMNDMRSSNIEMRSFVCWSRSREALEKLLEDERCEPYSDDSPREGHHRWAKSYRKGGPLEWFNPIDPHYAMIYGHGIQNLTDQLERMMHAAPEIT
jgi:hypothetical protein